MAHLSSSKETLDAVRTSPNAYSHSNQGNSEMRIQIAPLVESQMEQQESDNDYNSDGIVTPPLPSDWGLDASQSKDASSYFSSHANSSTTIKTNVKITANTCPSPSALPSIVDSLFDPRASTDAEFEYSLSQGAIQMEDVDYVDIPSMSSIDSNMETKTLKRRGKPLGSTKKKTFIKQEEVSEDEEKAIAIIARKSILKRVDHTETSRRGTSRDPTLERTVEFDLDVEQREEDDLEQQQQEEEEEVPLDEIPSESPALNPDFVFEPPDESMFQNLREYLEQQEEANRLGEVSDEEEDGATISDESYERRRLRKLRANEEILSKLGLGVMSSNLAANTSTTNSSDAEEEEETTTFKSSHGSKKKVYKYQRTIKIDADGTTTSLPLPGCTMEVSHIDFPVLRPRIRLQHIYYDDVPIFPPKPLVVESESEHEEISQRSPAKQKKEKTFVAISRRAPNGEAIEGAGTCCHQCRRKTTEPKMRCRYHEGGRVCPLYFCKRCLDIRYGTEFDEDSRTFQCPRCMAYCNCSLCLHRAGLAKFVPSSINSGLGLLLRDSEGNKIYESVRHYIDAKVGRAVKIGPGGLLGGARSAKKSVRSHDESDFEVKGQTSRIGGKSEKNEEKVKKRVKKVKDTIVPQKNQEKAKRGRPRRITSHPSNAEEGAESIDETGESSHPSQAAVSSTKRKIRLTFKARDSMEGNLEQRERVTTHIRAMKPVSEVMESVARAKKAGRPRGRTKSNAIPLQVINSANFWVKSKADEVAPSLSDGEEEEIILSEEESEESDDGAGQDEMEVRDTDAEGSIDLSRYSPAAGHVEFSYPHTSQPEPQLTMGEYSTTPNPSPFQSGEGFIIEEAEVDSFPFHSGPELALLMNQLRSAGYV